MKLLLSTTLLAMLLASTAPSAFATPVSYQIDDHHTYPSFEADHMGGLSIWRGKFNRSSGEIVLDREKKTGTVNIQVDVTSIDFGHNDLNAHALSNDIFNINKFPSARYIGTFTQFDGNVPTEVTGELTLHGITRPLVLSIKSFKCVPEHPVVKREVCGADAYGALNRKDFGIDYGLDKGFLPVVRLAIQVEAIRQ